jgi:ABC-type lipoprotein export system ATPase subunit
MAAQRTAARWHKGGPGARCGCGQLELFSGLGSGLGSGEATGALPGSLTPCPSTPPLIPPPRPRPQVGSLDIKLESTCDASECIDPEGPVFVGEARPRPANRDWIAPVVAAIPAALLGAGAAACCVMMASVLPYLRPAGHPGRARAAGKAASGGKAAGKGRRRGRKADVIAEEGGGAGGAPAALGPPAGPGPVAEGREPAAEGVDAGGRASSAGVTRPCASSLGGGDSAVVSVLPLASMRHPVQELSWSGLVVKTRVGGAPLAAVLSRLRPRRAARCPLPAAAGATATGADAQQQQVVIGIAGKDQDPEQPPATPPSESPAGSDAAGPDGKGDGGGGGAAAPPPPAWSEWKTILHGVGGAVRAREVAGVLGPSGSGKSTLLTALTGSLASDARWKVKGRVCLDGAPAGAHALARVTAMVPQDDLLLRSLTVEECLLYSAALRLPPALPPAAVHARVEDVMSELKIAHVRGSVVWSGAGAAAGVSGGERRRVAIGMELVTDPQVGVSCYGGARGGSAGGAWGMDLCPRRAARRGLGADGRPCGSARSGRA